MEDVKEASEKEYSEKELKEMREKAHKYYTERNKVLEEQLKHENLLADIEEAKLRSLIATVRIAQIMAPAPDEDDGSDQDRSPEEESGGKMARPLKRD